MMPSAAAPASAKPSPRRAAQRHLFGATATTADAIAHREREQRERVQAEARRVSGNFYVDRLIGSIRTR